MKYVNVITYIRCSVQGIILQGFHTSQISKLAITFQIITNHFPVKSTSFPRLFRSKVPKFSNFFLLKCLNYLADTFPDQNIFWWISNHIGIKQIPTYFPTGVITDYMYGKLLSDLRNKIIRCGLKIKSLLQVINIWPDNLRNQTVFSKPFGERWVGGGGGRAGLNVVPLVSLLIDFAKSPPELISHLSEEGEVCLGGPHASDINCLNGGLLGPLY